MPPKLSQGDEQAVTNLLQKGASEMKGWPLDYTVTITLPALTFLLCFYSIVIPDVKHPTPFFKGFWKCSLSKGYATLAFFERLINFVYKSPFSKVCFYPNRSFPEACGCFPADTLFSKVPQSRFHEMWRSLSNHAISVKVFVELLYQLCFFDLPTYLEISTKNLLKRHLYWCHPKIDATKGEFSLFQT